MHEWHQSLFYAQDYATRCAYYAEGGDLGTFLEDRMRCEAVCFCIIVIGEALNSIPRVLQNRVPEIPWASIIGMRNRIVHEYWHIDFATIFQVASHDAQRLANQLEEVMRRPA